MSNQRYIYLMHKDYPVAIFTMDNQYHIQSLLEIIDKKRFPIHSVPQTPEQGQIVIETWENTRVIPNARQNLERLIKVLGVTPKEAYIRSLRVSLTDCYWYKEENSELTWKDVNFYDNGFSSEFFLDIMCNESHSIPSFNIPDLTTNGILEKAWVMNNGVPALIKRGNYGTLSKLCPDKNILSANEIIASSVGDMINANIVQYSPITINNEILCICPSFIRDSNTDFIPADPFQRYTHTGNNRLYKLLCRYGFQEDTDKMIILDHIIHNADRHTFNFGLLRNAETLEITGFAPLFDNGCSLGYTKDRKFVKPFAETREEQLLLPKTDIEIPDIEEIALVIKNVYRTFKITDDIISYVLDDLKYSYDMYENIIGNNKRTTEYENENEIM